MNQRTHKYTPILIAAVFVIFGCYAFFFSIVTASGHMAIQDKEILDGKYYIYLDNSHNDKPSITQIECTKEQYDSVDIRDQVRITYKSSKFIPSKGKLIYLNLNTTTNSTE